MILPFEDEAIRNPDRRRRPWCSAQTAPSNHNPSRARILVRQPAFLMPPILFSLARPFTMSCLRGVEGSRRIANLCPLNRGNSRSPNAVGAFILAVSAWEASMNELLAFWHSFGQQDHRRPSAGPEVPGHDGACRRRSLRRRAPRAHEDAQRAGSLPSRRASRSPTTTRGQ